MGKMEVDQDVPHVEGRHGKINFLNEILMEVDAVDENTAGINSKVDAGEARKVPHSLPEEEETSEMEEKSLVSLEGAERFHCSVRRSYLQTGSAGFRGVHRQQTLAHHCRDGGIMGKL